MCGGPAFAHHAGPEAFLGPLGARVAAEDVAYVRHLHKAHRVERPGTALALPDGTSPGTSWNVAVRITVASGAESVVSVGCVRDCRRATPCGSEPEEEHDESPGVAARGTGAFHEKAGAAAEVTGPAL